MPNAFLQTLSSDHPSPDQTQPMLLYGRFIGSWTFDARRFLTDGTELYGRGEVHFGYVLEGRAIQDVWILPARDAGPTPSLGSWSFYGTTLRVYRPHTQDWDIHWLNPRNGVASRFAARAVGADIVQSGTGDEGQPVRWRFCDITPDSFLWLAEQSKDGGATWHKDVSFDVRRA